MKRFSERIGAKIPNKAIQVDGMSPELRNSIWNLVYNLYQVDDEKYWRDIAVFVARHYRKVPADEVPYDDYKCRDWMKKYFYTLEWFETYDILEFLVENHLGMTVKTTYGGRDRYYHAVKPDYIREVVNRILEAELSGFRFIGNILTPISDKAEVVEIEEAMTRSTAQGLDGAREHLKASLKLLGKKPEPDYRNAIKEAISAVESVARQLSGSPKTGIEGALEKLSKSTEIHPALKTGFKNLYGYASNEDGIRHAILDQPKVGFVEAKYMIVSCSAFINYLIQKAGDAGILKDK